MKYEWLKKKIKLALYLIRTDIQPELLAFHSDNRNGENKIALTKCR